MSQVRDDRMLISYQTFLCFVHFKSQGENVVAFIEKQQNKTDSMINVNFLIFVVVNYTV